MQAAAKAGARTLGGLPMLIYQGVEAFRLWTGREAPVEVMFKAARLTKNFCWRLRKVKNLSTTGKVTARH